MQDREERGWDPLPLMPTLSGKGKCAQGAIAGRHSGPLLLALSLQAPQTVPALPKERCRPSWEHKSKASSTPPTGLAQGASLSFPFIPGGLPENRGGRAIDKVGIQASLWLQEACLQGSWWPHPGKSRQEWGWELAVDPSPPRRQLSCQPPTAGLLHSLPAPRPAPPLLPASPRPLCAVQMAASVNKRSWCSL